MEKNLRGVPAVRLSRRLQLAAFVPPSGRGGRRGSAAALALMVDVSVEQALAAEVLTLVEHPFDRDAVVASTEKICEHVATVCADPRLAKGGAQVLVLLDTFACPAFLCPLARKLMRIGAFPGKHAVVTMRTNACKKTESGIGAAVAPAEEARPVGVVGDGRLKQVDDRFKGEAEERWNGWLPW